MKFCDSITCKWFVIMILWSNEDELMIFECKICCLSWCGRLSVYYVKLLREIMLFTWGANCWWWKFWWLLLIMTCLYGCKYLIMQRWICEDIIWWWKLYNIELLICAMSSLCLKVHASWSCRFVGEECDW